MSADIAGQELSVATVQGSELSINATDGVKVNDANVVQADIESFCRRLPDPAVKNIFAKCLLRSCRACSAGAFYYQAALNGGPSSQQCAP